MIVTFKTKAHPDITMFGDIAVRLIKLMGQSGAVPSALGADEVAEALVRLRKAADQDKRESANVEEQELEEGGERRINLYQRAYPLIELLEAAAAHSDPVMWDN